MKKKPKIKDIKERKKCKRKYKHEKKRNKK
jgi:hypothetical protein